MPFILLFERLSNPRDVLCGEVDADSRDQFERADAVATGLPQISQQVDSRLNACNSGEGCGGTAYFGEELQRCGGNDAESAFRTQEQRLDVIACVVFA